jgi:hypothetical protein
LLAALLTIAKINESSSLPPLETVLPRLYSGKFESVAALEQKFCSTPPKISELLCNKPAMIRIGIGANAKNKSKTCRCENLRRRRIG